MHKSIKEIAAKEYFPFVVLAAWLLVFHIPINTDFGDELIFRTAWEREPFWPWSVEMWRTWASRFLISAVMYLCSGLPQIFWKIANVCAMTAAAVCVSKLTDDGSGTKRAQMRNAIIAALFLLYNLYEMSSTGWIASTVNYMWPTACGLYVLLSVKRVCLSEKLKRYEYPLILAALLFAANHEQICAILLAVYLWYMIRCAARFEAIRQGRERVSRFILLQFSLCIANLVNILVCPGNSRRYDIEAAKFFPGHDALSIFEKVSIGFSSTLNYFVLTPNLPFIALSLLLAIGLFVRYKGTRVKFVSLVPIVVNLAAFVYIFFDFFMTDGSFTLKNPRDIFHLYGIIGTQEGQSFYVPHLLYAALACSFTVCLYLLFKGTGKFPFTFGVLSLGIASRVMMGLSPTVFASSYRTYLLLNFSFVITAAVIYQYIADSVKIKSLRYINALAIAAAAVNCLAISAGYQIVKPFFGRP